MMEENDSFTNNSKCSNVDGKNNNFKRKRSALFNYTEIDRFNQISLNNASYIQEKNCDFGSYNQSIIFDSTYDSFYIEDKENVNDVIKDIIDDIIVAVENNYMLCIQKNDNDFKSKSNNEKNLNLLSSVNKDHNYNIKEAKTEYAKIDVSLHDATLKNQSDKENSLDISPIQLKHNLFNSTHECDMESNVKSYNVFSKFNLSKLFKSDYSLFHDSMGDDFNASPIMFREDLYSSNISNHVIEYNSNSNLHQCHLNLVNKTSLSFFSPTDFYFGTPSVKLLNEDYEFTKKNFNEKQFNESNISTKYLSQCSNSSQDLSTAKCDLNYDLEYNCELHMDIDNNKIDSHDETKLYDYPIFRSDDVFDVQTNLNRTYKSINEASDQSYKNKMKINDAFISGFYFGSQQIPDYLSNNSTISNVITNFHEEYNVECTKPDTSAKSFHNQSTFCKSQIMCDIIDLTQPIFNQHKNDSESTLLVTHPLVSSNTTVQLAENNHMDLDMSSSSDDDSVVFRPSKNDLVKYGVNIEDTKDIASSIFLNDILNSSYEQSDTSNGLNSVKVHNDETFNECNSVLIKNKTIGLLGSSTPQKVAKCQAYKPRLKSTCVLSSSCLFKNINDDQESLINCELSSIDEESDEDENDYRIKHFINCSMKTNSDNDLSSSELSKSINSSIMSSKSVDKSYCSGNNSSYHSITDRTSKFGKRSKSINNENSNPKIKEFLSKVLSSKMDSDEKKKNRSYLSNGSNKLNIMNLSTTELNNLHDIKIKGLSDEEDTEEKKIVCPDIPLVVSESLNVNKVLGKKAASNINLNAMGDKALSTYHAQQILIFDVLEMLHKSLESRPTADIFLDDPQGLNLPLMEHQKHAIAWLMWRESQIPHGGILADDMGLGKTLTMISLILKDSKTNPGRNYQSVSNDIDRNKLVNGGTLIVCPASLINQWEFEVLTKLKTNTLNIIQYYGSNKNLTEKNLLEKDIVITSYQKVMWDYKIKDYSPLFKIKWKRIILDEAHVIRNYKSQTSFSVCSLSSIYRWAITGTPIHNKEADFFTLLKFIGCHPFDDWNIWKRWVDNNDEAGKHRLSLLANVLMLRRTKIELAKLTSFRIPCKSFHVVPVKLCKEEKEVYEQLLQFSSTLFEKYLTDKAKRENFIYNDDYHINKNRKYLDVLEAKHGKDNVFKGHPELQKLFQQLKNIEVVQTYHFIVLLLRLRQICCHPCLIKGKIDKREFIKNEGIENRYIKDLGKFNLDEEKKLFDKKSDVIHESKIFEESWLSSKIKAVCEFVQDKVLNTDDKAIIVSQWPSMLYLIENQLSKYNVNMVMYSGAVPVKARSKLVNEFNNLHSGPKIMLLSLTAGGVGLNLVAANHLFLVDIHWNPQLEVQACDRIYRVGQMKPVNIYKFVCTDTIEMSIQALQNAKLEIAENLFNGTNKVAASKISLNDLMEIFKVKSFIY
ncbi:transcription termination factor 2-like isoform X3 [Daktulosphaira vitifoliae]|uniref:transcription termination factor 2-like isoform X3 n=1 Tax=Daktulosphaira vitifoliae TaxID=58002 RepID=UPI0021A9854F|nr:transcription termination factor 2-like isoform X3 [Daktulosphaira vitifoliae]